MHAPNWFVGLVVPSDGWFDALPDSPPGTRYFHREDLHVNISFLGAAEQEDALRAWELAKRLSGGPFEFPLGAVESIGPSQKPTAWVVKPDVPLLKLNEFMAIYRNDIAQAARARPDMMPPRPMITIARPKRFASTRERTGIAQWAESIELPQLTLTLRDVALYTWSDEDDHHLFKIVDRFTLPPYDPSLWPKRYKLRYL